MYRKDPSAVSLPPPEGPKSGTSVIERGLQIHRGCRLGKLCSYDINTLPFPQTMELIALTGLLKRTG